MDVDHCACAALLVHVLLQCAAARTGTAAPLDISEERQAVGLH